MRGASLINHLNANSAMADSRFDPIEHEEVPILECGVSLLYDFELRQNWQDWTVGEHGIQAAWKAKGGRQYSATFLPEVAESQGWNHLDTIKALIRKAGCKFEHRLLEEMEITAYKSSKVVVSFEEYQQSRNEA